VACASGAEPVSAFRNSTIRTSPSFSFDIQLINAEIFVKSSQNAMQDAVISERPRVYGSEGLVQTR
jgi:hypothetical protein